MAPNISEDTNVKTPLAFLLKVFGGTIFVVYSAMLIYARLNTLEMEILRLKHEVEMNSDFRYTWPREGELPADVMQNMNIQLIKDRLTKHEALLDEIRYGTAR